jgi:hypothetical protein
VARHVSCQVARHVGIQVELHVGIQVASTSASRWHPSQQPCHISQQKSVTILFCHG